MEKIEATLHGRARKVVLDFGGWFEAAPEEGQQRPPNWKQMLSVLIAIYSVGMLSMLYINPRFTSTHLSLQLAVLRGNVISCCLLTWLIMPRLTGALASWLQPRKDQPSWWEPAGMVLVLSLVGLWALFFTWLTR